MSLAEIAREYATEKHRSTNHLYGPYPYDFHLNMVAEAAKQFIQDLPADKQEVVLAACWCHDLIEDARETYNDVRKVVGEEVAEIVYALTNEKGRTRKERASKKYYQGIRETPYADLVKICDRIANVTHSKNQNSRMLDVYRKEYPEFKEQLFWPGKWLAVWEHLDQLLDPNTPA
jgi:(p)ppGpp synthase/HD superfamily hydrolase